MAMDPSDATSTDEASSRKEVFVTDVQPSTSSTQDPATAGLPPKDGSVVSAMTEAGSLDCTTAQEQSLLGADNEEVQYLDVPNQVILQQGPDDFPEGGTALDQPPLVVTETPSSDNHSTVSMSAMPDRLPSLKVADNIPPESRSTTGDELRSPSPIDSKSSHSIDEYIRSPEVQNAIVERSPGGRYVRFMEKLGSGATKDVYRAYDTQEGIEVAWNVVTLSGVPKNERNRIVNEVRLLERLHHSNIISFHGSWVNRERQEVNFVTEILSSGTLKSFINKVKVIRWKIAKRWAVQILKGLEYLHSQEPPVIHRDLKCENVFINGTSGDLRIGDLGLSTVHRNGRVLSVLGTPEFMAPDMYEEGSYDESVDIYAFGMCMLEIFTQEIPYSECSNPAQIYKKVIAGDAPGVLKRLRSKHAREFVTLCLGSKNEDGNFLRPTAAELLAHPFLAKRANDDDEVVVDPPMRENAIPEIAAESSTSPTGTPSMKRNPSADVPMPSLLPHNQTTEPSSDVTPPAPVVSKARHMASTNSLDDEDDDDRFNEMPESETNMRKVKVLMGRGQELKEEDEPADGDLHEGPMDERMAAEGTESSRNKGTSSQSAASAPLDGQPPNSSSTAPASQKQARMQYLVAAAVIENESQNTRPYADEILKLVVTLPVEGQTQHVQFDFHLVQDDPVKVAKEMVQELGIPQDAVLEISETISGLACSARMKQDTYAVRLQKMQQAPQYPMQGMQSSGPQDPVIRRVIATPDASSRPEYGRTTSAQALPTESSGREELVLTHGEAPTQVLDAPSGSLHVPPDVRPSEGTLPQQSQQGSQALPAGGHVAPTLGNMPSMPESSSLDQPSQPSQAQHFPATAGISLLNGTGSAPTAQNVQSIATGRGPTVQKPPDAIAATGSLLIEEKPSATPTKVSASSVQVNGHGPHHLRNYDSGGGSLVDQQEVERFETNLSEDKDTDSDDDEEGMDEVMSEELRKLDEDFKRNLQRAKKVFDNRMDSLQRSQIEREAQHQKTLEKHEKERVEYEKRLAQEEEQQQRRLAQMKKEWNKKRLEKLAEDRKAEEQRRSLSNPPEGPNNGVHAAADSGADLPAQGRPGNSGHVRNNTSSSSSLPSVAGTTADATHNHQETSG